MCPYGYYLHPKDSTCIIGTKLIEDPNLLQPSANANATEVSSASPMFTSQQCMSSGPIPYPDYRYFIWCTFQQGSTIEFTQSFWECPFGLYYNPVKQQCTKSVFFSGQQVYMYISISMSLQSMCSN